MRVISIVAVAMIAVAGLPAAAIALEQAAEVEAATPGKVPVIVNPGTATATEEPAARAEETPTADGRGEAATSASSPDGREPLDTASESPHAAGDATTADAATGSAVKSKPAGAEDAAEDAAMREAARISAEEEKKKAAEAAPPAKEEPTLNIDVDLARQRMTVTDRGRLLYTWPVSSGRYGYPTPTGTFNPVWMTKMWYSRQYDYAPMPHSIFFSGGAAIHATSAISQLGRPASHGCVRLSPTNAATLFKLVSQHGKDMTKIVVHGKPNHDMEMAQRRYPQFAERFDYRRGFAYDYDFPPRAYRSRGYAYDYYQRERPRARVVRRYQQRGYWNSYVYGY